MLHDFLWTLISSFPVISPQMVKIMSGGKSRFSPSQLKVLVGARAS